MWNKKKTKLITRNPLSGISQVHGNLCSLLERLDCASQTGPHANETKLNSYPFVDRVDES